MGLLPLFNTFLKDIFRRYSSGTSIWAPRKHGEWEERKSHLENSYVKVISRIKHEVPYVYQHTTAMTWDLINTPANDTKYHRQKPLYWTSLDVGTLTSKLKSKFTSKTNFFFYLWIPRDQPAHLPGFWLQK